MSVFISNVSKIYNDYKPQFANDFEIEIYSNDNDTDNLIKDYITLHAKSIDFGEETLNLQRNYATKNFELLQKDAYKRIDDITIEWDESEDWLVKKFHDEWISKFYDRENDQFLSVDNTKELYKKFVVNVQSGIYCTKFTFENVLPNNRTGLNLKWTKSPTVLSNKMSYKVTNFSIKYMTIQPYDY